MTSNAERKNTENDGKTIEEKIMFLMNNGALLGIVMTLRMYKSLSGPEISNLLNIKKTTMFNYLNQLEEEGFIEMDEERSNEEWKKLGARARKYYRTTQLAEHVFDMYGQEGDSYQDILKEAEELPQLLGTPDGMESKMVKLIQDLARDKLELGSFVTMVNQMNTAIMNATYAELNKLIKLARKGAGEKKLKEAVKSSIFSSKTAININPFFIDLYTTEQAHEYLTTFWKFQVDISEMKERFDKENAEHPDQGTQDTQYLFMFSAPVKNN